MADKCAVEASKALFDFSCSSSSQSRAFDKISYVVLFLDDLKANRTRLIIFVRWGNITGDGIFELDAYIPQLSLEEASVHPLHGQHVVFLLAFNITG